MALRNEILVGRYNRLLQRLLSMKGGPPAPTLASDVQAQFDIERVPIELKFLLGWNIFSTGQFVAAGGAGNRAGARLFNPIGSGVIGIVEHIQVNSSAGLQDEPQLTRGPFPGSSPIPGGATAPGANRDIRTVSAGFSSKPSVLIYSIGNNVGAPVGAQLALGNYPVNGSIEFIVKHDDEIVIAPGDQISVFANTLNQGIAVTIGWRERQFEEGEGAAP